VKEFNAEKPIIVVSREVGSGTRDAFMELVYGSNFRDIELPVTAVSQNSTGAVLAKVKTDPQSIAYDSLGYITNDVKKLKVDGVACTIDNIADGSYKISRPLSVVYKEEKMNALTNKFLEFLNSKQAQELINELGYVGDSTKTANYQTITPLSGTIKVAGSTSLEPLMKELADLFNEFQPNVIIQIGGGGSGTGRNNVRDDVSDLGMVSSDVTPAQITDMQSKGGNVLVYKVASDGIAIIVHKTNSNDNITIAQLRAIYDKNSEVKYSNWLELYQ